MGPIGWNILKILSSDGNFFQNTYEFHHDLVSRKNISECLQIFFYPVKSNMCSFFDFIKTNHSFWLLTKFWIVFPFWWKHFIFWILNRVVKKRRYLDLLKNIFFSQTFVIDIFYNFSFWSALLSETVPIFLSAWHCVIYLQKFQKLLIFRPKSN